MKAIAILKHLTTFCGAELNNECIEAIEEMETVIKAKDDEINKLKLQVQELSEYESQWKKEVQKYD